jgi:hypothetical protein
MPDGGKSKVALIGWLLINRSDRLAILPLFPWWSGVDIGCTLQ